MKKSKRGRKRRYFPNNYSLYKDSPSSFFLPIEYEEFMGWKIEGWQLPSSVACIIRVTNRNTHKITEHIFNSQSSAEEMVRRLMLSSKDKGYEFVICDHENVHHLYPINPNQK